MVNYLQDEIVLKTKEGDFKLLKNGQLADMPSDELVVPEDDLISAELEEKVEAMAGLPGKKAGARFYFDVDDEYETEKLKNQGEEDKNILIKKYIDSMVNDIINSSGLSESKNILQMKSIIISRLRSVRSLAETREALLREHLGKEKTDELLSLIEKKRLRVEEVIKSAKKPFYIKAAGDKKPLITKTTKDMPLVVDKKVEPLKLRQDKAEKAKRKERQDGLQMHGVEYGKGHKVVSQEEIASHVTTGPIDELRQLSLKEFRRLGGSPADAAERLLEKIGLLEDESLIKKAEGVKAWQESEVYKTYLAIGAASMSERKPVEQVIREFRQAGKLYLAPEEFNVVADLNRKLSY